VPDRSRNSRAEVERDARARYPRQIEACEEFLAFAVEMLEASTWRGRPIKSSLLADMIVASEAARGLKSYRGALDTALGGYGPQAIMLDRALFEAMACCWWTYKNPKLAGERFEQHRRHQRGLWSKRLAATTIDEAIEDVPSEQEQRELDKLFGPWGDRLWCGLALHRVVDAIKDEWDQPELLKGYFAIAHAANNEIQHMTATSLRSVVISEDDSHLRAESGPSLWGVEQALHGALWSYGHLLRAVATHFEIEGREQIESVRARCEAQFVPLSVLNVEQNPGRNDPCPCGSGRKFKRCHGA
jgi:hypothetical protein